MQDSSATNPFWGCGCAFFGIFFLAGLTALFVVLALVVLPIWMVDWYFVPADGEIVQSRIREEFNNTATYYPEFLIRYTPADGLPRENWGFREPVYGVARHSDAWEEIDRYHVGQKLPCSYNTLVPDRVILESHVAWLRMLFLLIPVPFLGIGLSGMYKCYRARVPSPEPAAPVAKKGTSASQLLAVGGIFSVIGWVVLYGLYALGIQPERRAANTFVETTCEIVDSRLLSFRGRGGTHYRPEFKIRYRTPAFPDPAETWTYRITFSSSRDQAAETAVLNYFERGKTYPCWYDPQRPRRVVLDRSVGWFGYLMLVVPMVFIAVGGGLLLGYYYTRPSRSTAARE